MKSIHPVYYSVRAQFPSCIRALRQLTLETYIQGFSLMRYLHSAYEGLQGAIKMVSNCLAKGLIRAGRKPVPNTQVHCFYHESH